MAGTLDRRSFTKALGAAGAVAGFGFGHAPFALAQARPKVVIIGGGIGGATVANYLRKATPKVEITIVEPLSRITTCAGSNLFIGGVRTAEDLTHDFTSLRNRGIQVLRDTAQTIDTAKKSVTLASGAAIAYDKLVVSPGIDFKAIDGYDEAAAELMPHAWRGGKQMQILKRQIEDMEDGGTVVLGVPSGNTRCPPAPYERACMIAHYLKRMKPKSKVLLLDAKTQFVKEALFKEAFAEHYPNLIELNQSRNTDDLAIVRVDAKARAVTTRNGQTFKGAVINVIPPQKAGAIAVTSGLADGDWCPVDATTFEARKAKDVYILGDAVMADPMPKSGFAANSQAKLVAESIATELVKAPKYAPRLRNTCWSLLARADTVKMGAAYGVKDGKIVQINGFASAVNEPVMTRAKNTSEYLTWYSNMMRDSFGKTT